MSGGRRSAGGESAGRSGGSRYEPAGYPALYRDRRTGILYWRRVDPQTGQRRWRSLRTRDKSVAIRKMAEYEVDHERRRVGLGDDVQPWRRQLRPLAEAWLDDLSAKVGKAHLQTTRTRIMRTLAELQLETCADLDDVAVIHARAMALVGPGRDRYRIRRTVQDPLRQFSRWLAGNHRVLRADPLASWEPIDVSRRTRSIERRAFHPDEVARALRASDWIDETQGREHRMRMLWVVLLVTAPRTSTLFSRRVSDYDSRARRIVLPPGRGKKRNGMAMLDEVTAGELEEYIGERRSGPLMLSPSGARLHHGRPLDWWREAFGAGLAMELGGQGEELSYWAVREMLAAPRQRAVKLGRVQLLARELAEEIRQPWTARMQGVDLHAFRKTLRTWCTASGVAGSLIDLQIGHEQPDTEVLSMSRVLAGSRTGRRHYLDRSSELFDVAEVARTMRRILDDAYQNAYRNSVSDCRR